MLHISKRLALISFALIFWGFTFFAFFWNNARAGEDPKIEVELTESFYRALRNEGTKTYATDKSEEYLRQIAISSRYAVETNLKIIKQQERIIELLETIKDKERTYKPK